MNAQHPILLVEDDQLDALTFQRALRDLELNYAVVIATTGEAALQLLESHSDSLPNIILLDLNMPRMNGIEFLTRLKQHPVWRRIPVVILTTSSQEQERQQCFDLSVAGYMVKPLDYGAFVQMVSVICAYWYMNTLAN